VLTLRRRSGTRWLCQRDGMCGPQVGVNATGRTTRGLSVVVHVCAEFEEIKSVFGFDLSMLEGSALTSVGPSVPIYTSGRVPSRFLPCLCLLSLAASASIGHNQESRTETRGAKKSPCTLFCWPQLVVD
jgi:hypothetical protein